MQSPMLGRFAALLLGAAALFQGGSAFTATAAAPARLIYCGWFGNTIPTPAFVAGHKAFLETQPFDGLVVYLRNDSTGANATPSVMSATPVSYTTLTSILAPLRGQTFTTLRDNFALLQSPNPPDFFDDWSVVVQNFATLARALKEAGLKGIFLDNEQYSKKWGNYPLGVRYTNKTLAEYQVQARLRGRQVMQAMVAQFPEIAFLSMHGPTVSEPKVPEPLFPVWYAYNELLGPFSVGIMEGSGSLGLNLDGGELYHLRSSAEFQASANWRRYTLPSSTINCAFIPLALRPAWPGKTSISFGVYDRPFRGAAMDSTIIRPTIANALRTADRYVWFYTESSTFLLPSSQGGAGSAWVNAVRQARLDAGSTGTGSGPAAPSHFAAAAISSSAVDLSWWDMSANETGFEIERKTGSTGTWARVLTTGANISTIDDIGLAAGTTYVYRARAVNASGASAYTAEVTTTTAAASLGPPPPKNLSIRSLAVGRISITWWDMSSTETGFQVERKSGSAGTWSRIFTTGANISIYDNTGLPSGTSYTYRVRSVNLSGASSYTNEVTATVP